MGDFNIFEGMTSHGSATMTICAGRIVYENGQIAAAAGTGKYLSLTANSPYIFGVIQQRERVRFYDCTIYFTMLILVFKVCQPEKVERTDTPVVAKSTAPASTAPSTFHSRPPTSSGGRNQFDSSFSVGGMLYAYATKNTISIIF